MKNFILIGSFVGIFLLSGCAAQTRLTRLKDRQENIVTTQVSGSISEAKDVVRKAAIELNLREIKKLETENFIALKYHNMTKSVIGSSFGLLGFFMMNNNATPSSSLMGVFFEENKEKNVVDITVSEEVTSIALPFRHALVDKIQQKMARK